MSILLILAWCLIGVIAGGVGAYQYLKPQLGGVNPLSFPEHAENELCFYEENYIIYKLYRGVVVEMEDCKNAVQCHSRMEELSRGENSDLEIRLNFNTGQYEYAKDKKTVDSTDVFY